MLLGAAFLLYLYIPLFIYKFLGSITQELHFFIGLTFGRYTMAAIGKHVDKIHFDA